MTQAFTAADGTRLAYRDEGAGLPVLCLAGLTRNMQDFDYLVPHLPPVRLIRMDYRGRGESGWADPASYTVAQEARDAVALIDHLGVDKVALIGSSRGGLIGMQMAKTEKHRLKGILFNDIGPEIPRAALQRLFLYLGRPVVAKTHEELAARMPGALPGFENVPAGRWLSEVRHQYRAGPEGLEISYDPALREPFLQAYSGGAFEDWPAYDACAGLTLALIRGANSDLLTRETADEMRRRRPDMIFAEVPDRGHLPFLDEPEALAAISAFLEACA